MGNKSSERHGDKALCKSCNGCIEQVTESPKRTKTGRSFQGFPTTMKLRFKEKNKHDERKKSLIKSEQNNNRRFEQDDSPERTRKNKNPRRRRSQQTSTSSPVNKKFFSGVQTQTSRDENRGQRERKHTANQTNPDEFLEKSPIHKKHCCRHFSTASTTLEDADVMHRPQYPAPMHQPNRQKPDYFSRNHAFARQYAIAAKRLAPQAVQQMEINPNCPFVMVDYGAANGANSRVIFSSVMDQLERRFGAAKPPCLLIFEDRHDNDFRATFSLIQGFHLKHLKQDEDDISSRVGGKHNVFPLGSGISFYSQCFPDNFVQFGFSASAIHWLREQPSDLGTCLIHMDPLVTDEDKALYRTQARLDWELFLLQRAQELCVGGHLIISTMTFDHALNEKFGWKGAAMLQLWKDIWGEMLSEGLISKTEHDRAAFISYFRSEMEFREPFRCPTCPVRAKGLDLVSMDFVYVPDPVKSMQGLKTPDRVEKYSKALRIIAYETFKSALDYERPQCEQLHIMQQYWSKLEMYLAADIDKYWVDNVIALIHLVKRRPGTESSGSRCSDHDDESLPIIFDPDEDEIKPPQSPLAQSWEAASRSARRFRAAEQARGDTETIERLETIIQEALCERCGSLDESSSSSDSASSTVEREQSHHRTSGKRNMSSTVRELRCPIHSSANDEETPYRFEHEDGQDDCAFE